MPLDGQCSILNRRTRGSLDKREPVQGASLIGENKERWRELCEQAAKEQDPEKLHKLVAEINRLLEEKEARLKGKASTSG